MNGFQRVAVIIAATGMAATLVAPSAQTAKVIGSILDGVTKWSRVEQGRG